MIISRGDIFLASLDPVIGHEISKTHPVIVVSNDISNKHSETLTIIPVTSQHWTKIYPMEEYAYFYSLTCREYEDTIVWMQRQIAYRGYA